jgi:hypothetical protein
MKVKKVGNSYIQIHLLDYLVIRHRREDNKKHPARRWVVERTNSWHNTFRKLFTRYEKKDENYLGLVQLANSIIVYKKIILGQVLSHSIFINLKNSWNLRI